LRRSSNRSVSRATEWTPTRRGMVPRRYRR
jgi:hypothetical protein